jgi:hypothetical protein
MLGLMGRLHHDQADAGAFTIEQLRSTEPFISRIALTAGTDAAITSCDLKPIFRPLSPWLYNFSGCKKRDGSRIV